MGDPSAVKASTGGKVVGRHAVMQSSAGVTPPIEVRSTVPTEEGTLEVVARQVDRRWVVSARCAEWHATAIDHDLAAAVDAALQSYADGVPLIEGSQ